MKLKRTRSDLERHRVRENKDVDREERSYCEDI